MHDDKASVLSLTSNTVRAELAANELAQTLRNVDLKHPALNRVRVQLLSAEGVETAITSYDRMHHRHNRS